MISCPSNCTVHNSVNIPMAMSCLQAPIGKDQLAMWKYTASPFCFLPSALRLQPLALLLSPLQVHLLLVPFHQPRPLMQSRRWLAMGLWAEEVTDPPVSGAQKHWRDMISFVTSATQGSITGMVASICLFTLRICRYSCSDDPCKTLTGSIKVA